MPRAIENFVVDTNGLISFYPSIFKRPSSISPKALSIIESAFSPYSNIRLTIPSIVFVEIFDKWIIDEESAAKFWYEAFQPIIACPNIELAPIDEDTLNELLTIRNSMADHDIHDKLILACAKTLNCKLISSDRTIGKYVRATKAIPGVIR